MPASVTCTSIVRRADTSRSVVVRVSCPASVASRSTPVSAGIPGRDDTPRCTVCNASDSASRSHRNFTSGTPYASSVLNLTSSSRACGTVENRAFPSVEARSDMWTGWGEGLTTSPGPGSSAGLSPPIRVVVHHVHTELLTRPRTMRVRSWTCRKVASRARISSSTFLMPCRTVVWSRPPNDVADLHEGQARALAHDVHGDMPGGRERPRSDSHEVAWSCSVKYVAVSSMIRCGGISASACGSRSSSACSASSW